LITVIFVGAIKFGEVLALKGYSVIGIGTVLIRFAALSQRVHVEYHGHGRSSLQHRPRGDLPAEDILIDDLFDIIRHLLSGTSPLPRRLSQEHFAVSGHRYGIHAAKSLLNIIC
jgi:hypothetical protein